MEQALKDILTMSGVLLSVVLITILVIARLQKGFFWKFLRVKQSKGDLKLIRCRGADTRTDWEIGKVEDNLLKFKRHKQEKFVAIKDSTVFYNFLGVIAVDFDDKTGQLLTPELKSIEGYDHGITSNLYKRILMAPKNTDDKWQTILIMCICILLIVIAVAFIVYNQGTNIDSIKVGVKALQEVNKTVIIASQGGI